MRVRPIFFCIKSGHSCAVSFDILCISLLFHLFENPPLPEAVSLLQVILLFYIKIRIRLFVCVCMCVGVPMCVIMKCSHHFMAFFLNRITIINMLIHIVVPVHKTILQHLFLLENISVFCVVLSFTDIDSFRHFPFYFFYFFILLIFLAVA